MYHPPAYIMRVINHKTGANYAAKFVNHVAAERRINMDRKEFF